MLPRMFLVFLLLGQRCAITARLALWNLSSKRADEAPPETKASQSNGSLQPQANATPNTHYRKGRRSKAHMRIAEAANALPKGVVPLAANLSDVLGAIAGAVKSLTETQPTLKIAAGATSPKWKLVEKALANFTPISFTAGDAEGRKFDYSVGQSPHELMEGASFGKWTGATAIAGAVADGNLTFDTRACDVFPWWTKDPKDKRSRVTLRHLLTFTSGFTTNSTFLHDLQHSHIPYTHTCINPIRNWAFTPASCAKQLYESAKHSYDPGTAFTYNSLHLQIAFGMATARTRMDANAFLNKYLYIPAHMSNTSYGLHGRTSNPAIGFEISSNMYDVDHFVQRYLAYKILPKHIIKIMDTEYVQANKAQILSPKSVQFPSKQATKLEKRASSMCPWRRTSRSGVVARAGWASSTGPLEST